jgi:hypothetical protein
MSLQSPSHSTIERITFLAHPHLDNLDFPIHQSTRKIITTMSARFAPIVRSRVALSTAPRFVAFRSISSTPSYQKGPVDAAKDTLKKADDMVSKVAVKGIDKGGMCIP